jgi:hypothetical protein
MKELLTMLEGKKTYILVGIAIVSTIGYNYGFVQYDAWQSIMAICGFGGIATMRSALTKK